MKHLLLPLMRWVGLDPDDSTWARLEQFQEWLATEASEAGGLGPHEHPRLSTRHIGDSIAYLRPLTTDTAPDTAPDMIDEVIDYGSGVGLPGIPLAIVAPDMSVTLRDRSRRRIELIQRITRILGLDNVSVEQGLIEDDRRLHHGIVTRAVAPPDKWIGLMGGRLAPGGRAVTSLGGSPFGGAAPSGFATEIVPVPPEILDHSPRFLIMTRTE